MYKCQNICIKNKRFIYLKVLLRFLPNIHISGIPGVRENELDKNHDLVLNFILNKYVAF